MVGGPAGKAKRFYRSECSPLMSQLATLRPFRYRNLSKAITIAAGLLTVVGCTS